MLDYKSKVRHLKIKFMDGSVKTLQVISLFQLFSLQSISLVPISMLYAHIVHLFLHVLQCAKKFLTDSMRLEDFPVGLLDSVYDYVFCEEIQMKALLHKIGLVRVIFRIVHHIVALKSQLPPLVSRLPRRESHLARTGKAYILE